MFYNLSLSFCLDSHLDSQSTSFSAYCPSLCLIPQNDSHFVGGFLLLARQHMSVDVSGCADFGMSQNLRDNLERDALRQHEHSSRVARIVKAHLGQSGLLKYFSKTAV